MNGTVVYKFLAFPSIENSRQFLLLRLRYFTEKSSWVPLTRICTMNASDKTEKEKKKRRRVKTKSEGGERRSRISHPGDAKGLAKPGF